MVDGYPLDPKNPDFEVHQSIDRMLENCRAMRPQRSMIGELYPELFRAQDRAPWLTPALQRLDWNLRKNLQGEQWAAHLAPMINLVLGDLRKGTEDQLGHLCEWSGYLAAHHCHSIAEKISIFAWELQKKAELSAVTIQQLEKALAAFPRPGTDTRALFRIGWTLFRAANHTTDGDPCWSAAIRRALRAMPKNPRESWLALLDANDHAIHFSNSLPKPAAKLLTRVGPGLFAADFAEWTQSLADKDHPHLSHTGMTLLNWLLRLCAAAPDFKVDESLYRIACARWREPSEANGWLPAYLMVLPTRPNAGAFACVEALAMNPATRGFSDVSRLYQALLTNSVSSGAPPGKATTGIDGFAIDPADRFAGEQLMIDEYLKAAHPDELMRGGIPTTSGDRLAPVRASLIQRAASDSAGGLNRLAEAIAARVAWIAGHSQGLDENTRLFWRVETGKLMTEALRKVTGPSRDVVIASLQSDSLNFFGYSPAERVFELCELYVDQHGWDAQLVKAIEPWMKTLHGSISAQNLRRRVGWFLLFEEVSPIKIADCWGNQVRSDLRKIPEAERRLWRAVLGNASFSNVDKPPAKWLKPAKAAFAQLGGPNFRARFTSWFEPFRSAEPLKLTVPGRDLLRILMWYAIVAEDPAVDEALAWYAKGKWKNQASASRADTTATAFAYVMRERDPRLARQAFEEMLASGATAGGGKIERAYQELCAEQAAQPRPPRVAAASPDFEALKAKFLGKNSRLMKDVLLQMFSGDSAGPLKIAGLAGSAPRANARWDGDTLVLDTSRDTYRLEVHTSRITRQSDGAVILVEIPWEEPNYRIFRDMVDARDLGQPGQPNWVSLALCARVLADESQSSRIIVDPSTGDVP